MPGRRAAICRDVSEYLATYDAASVGKTLGISSLHLAFVYDRRGARLAVKSNRPGNRSCGAGYDKYTIHAERAALRSVGDVSLLRDATLIVMRFDGQGRLRLSAPCHACCRHIQAAISKHGLKRVMYSV